MIKPWPSFGNIYVGLGEKDQAFAWLERAYEARSWYLTWLKVDRSEDELTAADVEQALPAGLLRRVGLTQ